MASLAQSSLSTTIVFALANKLTSIAVAYSSLVSINLLKILWIPFKRGLDKIDLTGNGTLALLLMLSFKISIRF